MIQIIFIIIVFLVMLGVIFIINKNSEDKLKRIIKESNIEKTKKKLDDFCKKKFDKNYKYDKEKKKCIKETSDKDKDTSDKDIETSDKDKETSDIDKETSDEEQITNEEGINKVDKTEPEKVVQCNNEYECNYSGKCINNICVCENNYGGEKCSINLCNNIQINGGCMNGFCQNGNCKCFPGWGLMKDNTGVHKCILEKCANNKCGQDDLIPRGICNKNEDPLKDGKCECKNGWEGEFCNKHKCYNLNYDVKSGKFVSVKKCKNNSYCDSDGKCHCNVIYDDVTNEILKDDKGNLKRDPNLFWLGSNCTINKCLDNNLNPKCKNGSCDKDTGKCICDFGYSQNDNCKINGCPNDCENGKCIRTGGSNWMGKFSCLCDGDWLKDSEGKCTKNNCFKQDSEGKYIKNELSDSYVEKCNSKTSKCILKKDKTFKKCECINGYAKTDPKSDKCDKCEGDLEVDSNGKCTIINCDSKQGGKYYFDKPTESCLINVCDTPSNCSFAAHGTDKIPCKTNKTEQCKTDGCDNGYYYKDKVCYNSLGIEIDCDNKIEHFSNSSENNYHPTRFHNYCRNPDGHTDLWCYYGKKKSDGNFNWDVCNDNENSDKTSTYRGEINKTKEGNECIYWGELPSWHHNHPSKNINSGLIKEAPLLFRDGGYNETTRVRKFCMIPDSGWAGFYRSESMESENDCKNECANDFNCKAYIYNNNSCNIYNYCDVYQNVDIDKYPDYQTLNLVQKLGSCYNITNNNNFTCNDNNGDGFANAECLERDGQNIWIPNMCDSNKSFNFDKNFFNYNSNNPQLKNSCEELSEELNNNLNTLTAKECSAYARNKGKYLNPIGNIWVDWPRGCFIYRNNYYFSHSGRVSGSNDAEASCDETSPCICKTLINDTNIQPVKNNLDSSQKEILKKEINKNLETKDPLLIIKEDKKNRFFEENLLKEVIDKGKGIIPDNFYKVDNSKTKYGQCKINKCKCENGVGAEGTDCLLNGYNKCIKCNNGMYKKYSNKTDYYNDENFECVPCNNYGDVIDGDKCKNCSYYGCSGDKGECKDNKCECIGNNTGSFCEICKGEFEGDKCDINRCGNHSNSLLCNRINVNSECKFNSEENKSECICNCNNDGICNSETGICQCITSHEGPQCNIQQCDPSHSNTFVGKCKNNSICKSNLDGSAYCDCTGTGKKGIYCENTLSFDEINSGECFNIDKYNFLNNKNTCNILDIGQKENNCKNKLKRNPVYNSSGELLCIPKLIIPRILIKEKLMDRVILKLYLDYSSGDFYKIDNFNNLELIYELSYDENVIENSFNINTTSPPNISEPFIKFKLGECDSSNLKNCLLLEIINLDSNKEYSLKIKYKISILTQKEKKSINYLSTSKFSNVLTFKTNCDLENLKKICKNKCGESANSICGPSENSPIVSENMKDSAILSWPYYKTIDYKKCDCKEFDILDKTNLCNTISDKSGIPYIFRNAECANILNNEYCKNEKSNLDPYYHQYFDKIADKITDYTTCTLPERNKLKEICENNKGYFVSSYNGITDVCFPQLGAPVIEKVSNILYDQATLTFSLSYEFKDTYKLICKVNGQEKNIKKIEKKNDNYSFTIDELQEQTEYTIYLKIKNSSQNSQKSIFSLPETFITLCNSNKYTDSNCKGKYGPQPITGNSSVEEKKNPVLVIDINKDRNALNKWPYFRKSSNNNCSCIDLNNIDREGYCEGKNGYNGFEGYKYNLDTSECLKVKTLKDCIDETPDYFYPLFRMIPNNNPRIKSTKCRELSVLEKENKCNITKNKQWWISDDGINYKCRNKILIKTLDIIKVESYNCKFMINYILNDNDVTTVRMEYKLFNNKDFKIETQTISLNKVELINNKFSTLDPGITRAQFSIDNLTSNSDYKIKVTLKTEFDNYNSEESDFLSFKTVCDTTKFTFNKCKSNYGPRVIDNGTVHKIFIVNNEVTEKDPSVSIWPYHKKEGACGCKIYDDKERIKYCKDLIGNDINESLVKETNGTCQNNIPLVGPVKNLSVRKLAYNEYLEGDKLLDNAQPDDHNDYRVLIEWSKPDIPDKIIHRGNIIPTKYSIYRIHNNNSTKIYTFDPNNKSVFIYLDESGLINGEKYKYKINPVNDAGEFDSDVFSDEIEFEKVLKQSDCDKKYDSLDSTLKYKDGSIFKGFHKVIDHDKNICIVSPSSDRTKICQDQIKKIIDKYENTYDSKLKKCISNSEPLVLPGVSTISKESKGVNYINLNLNKSKTKCNPEQTGFYIKFKKNSEEFKILENNINNTNFFTRNNYKHNNLDPGTTYTYKISSISDNLLWTNFRRWGSNNDNEPTKIENKYYGQSDYSDNVSIKTDYDTPKYKGIKITKSKITNSKISFYVNKIPSDQSKLNTLDKGGFDSLINKIKIIKYIKFIEGLSISSFKSLMEFEFNNSNDLKKYHKDGILFTELKNKFEIIDLGVEHATQYKYVVLIKNNKKNKYEEVNNIIVNTEQKNFISKSSKIVINDYNFKFNTDIKKANTSQLSLKFKEQIDPNIDHYDNNYIYNSLEKYCNNKYESKNDNSKCDYDINILNQQCKVGLKNRDCKNMCCKFGLEEDNLLVKSFISPFKMGHSEYKITIYNNSETTIYEDTIPYIDIYKPTLNLLPDTDYKITISVKHFGSLILQNGVKIPTICNSKKSNISFKTPKLNKNVCKLYKQLGSIVDKNSKDEDVSYYYNTDKNECLPRQYNQLNNWCHNFKPSNSKFRKYGPNYIYKEGKCVKKVHGKWIKQKYPDDISCSAYCNTGKTKVKQWNYKSPQNGGDHIDIFPVDFDAELKNNIDFVGFKNDNNDVSLEDLKKLSINEMKKKIQKKMKDYCTYDNCKIFVYKECNKLSCKNLCENIKLKYWNGYSKYTGKPINEDDFYASYMDYKNHRGNNKCIKINPLGRLIEEKLKDKCKCAGPEKNEINEITCIDGAFNDSNNLNNCKKARYNFVNEEGKIEKRYFDEKDSNVRVEEINLVDAIEYEKKNKKNRENDYDEAYKKLNKTLKKYIVQNNIKCNNKANSSNKNYNYCPWKEDKWSECKNVKEEKASIPGEPVNYNNKFYYTNTNSYCTTDTLSNNSYIGYGKRTRVVRCTGNKNEDCDPENIPDNIDNECILPVCPVECEFDNKWVPSLQELKYGDVEACIEDKYKTNYKDTVNIGFVDDFHKNVCSGGKRRLDRDILKMHTSSTKRNDTCSKNNAKFEGDNTVFYNTALGKMSKWIDCNLQGDSNVCNGNGVCIFDKDNNNISLSCNCKNKFYTDSNNNCKTVTCPDGYSEKHDTCERNICTCENGIAAEGSNCDGNKNKCTKCNPGFHLVGNSCEENICTCSFGTGARGTTCETHGSDFCSSCNPSHPFQMKKKRNFFDGLVGNACFTGPGYEWYLNNIGKTVNIPLDKKENGKCFYKLNAGKIKDFLSSDDTDNFNNVKRGNFFRSYNNNKDHYGKRNDDRKVICKKTIEENEIFNEDLIICNKEGDTNFNWDGKVEYENNKISFPKSC
jgi:hypothetical protein